VSFPIGIGNKHNNQTTIKIFTKQNYHKHKPEKIIDCELYYEYCDNSNNSISKHAFTRLLILYCKKRQVPTKQIGSNDMFSRKGLMVFLNKKAARV